MSTTDDNIFFVDWSKGAKTFDYVKARTRISDVAQSVSFFIQYLHEHKNLSLENVTIIGFSLGAHIAGLTGNKFDGEIGKIIGTDPAGPLFHVNDPDNRLTSHSAQYTECYHTGFPFGIQQPICRVDFYFNSGSKQPGCLNSFGLDDMHCSHVRAMEYFKEALYHPGSFYGFRCQSENEAINMACKGEHGAFVFDSKNEAEELEGIFHVTTNSDSPFGQGKPGG